MAPYDLIVIGSGTGGYVAAIRAAQLGMKVICVEKENTFGGTCLNVGCIPSKALLHSSEEYTRLNRQGKELGVEYSGLQVNWPQMLKRKEAIVAKLVEGISFLFRKNKVESIQGTATFRSPSQIAVQTAQKEVLLEGKNILIATGSEPIPLPFLPFDEKVVLSSTGALSLPTLPKKLLLVGAGVIGLELGSVYQRLGTEVTVIEMMDRICPTLDLGISKALLSIFQKQGIRFYLSSQVIKGEKEKEGIQLTLDNQEVLKADVVLVAIGRRSYTQGLGLEYVGIQTTKGQIIVDSFFRTTLPHVFAVGDVIDGPMLAHKSSEEAIAVVEYLTGHFNPVNYLAIPNVMYTFPEVASIGMTEEEAKAAQIDLTIGIFPLSANSRARCTGETEGFVKILAHKKTGRLIGMHIIAPHASEMIGEGVIAITKRMTVQELAQTFHAHPTFSEAIKEAALGAFGPMIHIV